MKLTSKTITAGTRQIQATVSTQQIDDLNKFSFYYVIKSKLDKIINNDLISFTDKDELYLYVNINYKLFTRVKKLYKINPDESTKKNHRLC